jgi:hypothetical protein
MIRRAVAVRFDRPAEAGRTRPILAVVETSDGVEHEVYLKASGAPDLGVEGLANEAIAALLAADLSLPITEPFLVDLGPGWIQSIPDPTTRGMLTNSSPVAFASKSAGVQWRPWTRSDRLSNNQMANALAIFFFDALIQNDDRRPDNPNLLVKGSEFRIIDHELAFRLRLKLFPPPEPWRVGSMASGLNLTLGAHGGQRR